MFDFLTRVLGIKPPASNDHPITALFDLWLAAKERGPRRVLDHNMRELGGSVRKEEELPSDLRAYGGPDHRGWLPIATPARATQRRGLRDPDLEMLLRDGAGKPPSR
jgi:hypothetical protein